MIIIALCLALLSAGCVEQKSETNSVKTGTTADKARENLTVNITSPKAGDILQGNNDFSFASTVSGGKSPLSFVWSSSIDGVLSTSQSFPAEPLKTRQRRPRHHPEGDRRQRQLRPGLRSD